MKKIISCLLAALLLFACALPAAAEGGYYNFEKSAEYASGTFTDVPEDAWYADDVAAVYELGLMQGADGLFRPSDSVTLGEAAALASRIHSIYHAGGTPFFAATDPWFDAYVDYAAQNGIISDTSMSWETPATRAQFVGILAHALPQEALPSVNSVADGQLPDVKMDGAYASEIYSMYRAGILAGNNRYGSFAPDTTIQRASAAAIVARMAYRSLRLKYTLEELTYPDLAEQSAVSDDFFSNAAMLGNSLAQGMQLYSGLRDAGMSFFCYQSVTVNNADEYVSQLCQRQYDRVYIEYGINEIYMEPSAFAAAYGKIVDRIRAAMPDAEIYVMAVTPVTEARSAGGSFTMTRIRALNAALHDMAAERECWYLDCCETLCDETGYLVGSYAGWDGSPHLAESGYRAWADVMRTYYA